jgi:hypothetical protein
MGRRATADWSVTAESGLTRYLWKIRQFRMLEPHEEYVLAKRRREHGHHEAATRSSAVIYASSPKSPGVPRLRAADL